MTLPQRRAAGAMAQAIPARISARPARSAPKGLALQRFIAGWAAFGVTLSGATQLRMAGLPAGPAELILAAWVGFVVFLVLRGVRFAGGRVAVILGTYWLCALTFMGLGALVAVQTRRMELGAAAHDGMAFVYMGVLSTFLALRLFDQDTYRYHWHFARLNFLFHAAVAGVLLGVAMIAPQLGPLRLWYGGIRFSGWSENPNQMALAMAAMPFLGWWQLRRTPGRFGKTICGLGIALCVAAGFATLSDGLRAGWLASLGVIGGLLFYRTTMRGRSKWLYISHVMIPALVLILGTLLGGDMIDRIYRAAQDIYAEGDQGEKRFTLWSHGLAAIRVSPLFGFGPGPFSGYGGPFEGWEAHNSFIDWGMSTGVAGVLLYAVLLGWIGWRAFRSHEMTLIGMWVSVVVVSFFGYVLRQPDFWTAMVLVLVLSEIPLAVRAQQGSPAAPPGAPARQLRPARAPPVRPIRTR